MKFNLFCLLLILSIAQSTVPAQKISAEDVVKQHLDSIGTSTARSAVKNQIAVGTVSYTILRQGGIGNDGKAVLASEADKIILGMTFDNPNYPFEKFGFNDGKVKIAFVRPGVRSPLGNFLDTYNNMFGEKLLGGVLNVGWGLKDVQSRKAKLDFGGKKKVNGKDAYVLSYAPRKGADITIKLFFDAENFRHLRTEYNLVKSAQMGSVPDASARQRESRQSLIEEFSDFKKVNELTLPHSHRIYLALDGQAGTSESEWRIKFSQFYFNQELAPNSFDIEAK